MRRKNDSLECITKKYTSTKKFSEDDSQYSLTFNQCQCLKDFEKKYTHSIATYKQNGKKIPLSGFLPSTIYKWKSYKMKNKNIVIILFIISWMFNMLECDLFCCILYTGKKPYSVSKSILLVWNFFFFFGLKFRVLLVVILAWMNFSSQSATWKKYYFFSP